MKESLYYKYREDYSDKIARLFEKIEELEKEIQGINTDISFKDICVEELAIRNFKWEITKYFQYNNGSLGFDIVLIKYILHDLLLYIYIVKEKELSEEGKNTCKFEIEIRFCFFLNHIYNFKEKFEIFFKIKDENILTSLGKELVSKLFNKSYKKIKKYCDARGALVHGIYDLCYNILKNEIKISSSKFNLSDVNIVGQKIEQHVFVLEDVELVRLVEEIQELRKKSIEILLDIDNNIDKKKLIYKFRDGKGYTF